MTVLFLAAMAALAGEPAAPERAPDLVVTADLAEGAVLTSLGWAQDAAVACLPSTRWRTIKGNALWFEQTVPAATGAFVEVVPADGQDVTLLVIVDPKGDTTSSAGVRPPNISRANSCGKSYWNGPGKAERLEVGQRAKEQTLLIGVFGTEGTVKGGFELRLWRGK